MKSFSVDYNGLSNSFDRLDKKVFKLADVKDRLKKVAFDVVCFRDGDPDELWQIQSADDGEFVVARYDAEDVKTAATTETKEASNWNCAVSKTSSDINVFYKGRPITKIAGVDTDDIETVQRFLPQKLASDKEFAKAFIASLDTHTKQELLKLYPELSK